MVVPKPVVKVIALAIVILLLVPVVAGVSVPRVLAEDVAVSDVDRSKLIMLAMIALMFSDITLDQVERYELLNTLYIYRNGSVELVKSPYLPGDLVLNMTRIVVEVRKNMSSISVSSPGEGIVNIVLSNVTIYGGTISYGNVTIARVDNSTIKVFANGTEVATAILGREVSSWSIVLGESHSRIIDDNTVVYWRSIAINISNTIVNYTLIQLIRNVSDTHRVYITSVAELKSDGSGYSYVFTYANYWFKNKTTFYGDWIALPEGASSLSDYYRLVAYGVKWLSQNVYNGASPGYFTRGRNSGYVPQAYPQIANALETLASNIPAEINLPVEKGYALITDVIPLAIVKYAVISGIASAVGSVLVSYAMGERGPRKLALDAAVGFVSGFIGGFTGGLRFGLKPTGIARVANYIWNVQVSIWINSVYTALATPPQQFLQSFGLGTLVDMLTSFLSP
jgi:hypothetical protein